MNEAMTANGQQEQEEGSRRKIIAFEIIAISFFTLSLAASIVIMLRPLEVFPRGAFPGNAARALWLLFILGLAFGIVLYTLGATKYRRRKLSGSGGTNYLILGFLCAVEIFWIRAHAPGVTTSTTSLWWLCVILTVLGGIGVYLPVRAKRLEEEEAKRKGDEAKRKALAKEVRTPPTIVRLKVRRYYVSQKKIFDCKD